MRRSAWLALVIAVAAAVAGYVAGRGEGLGTRARPGTPRAAGPSGTVAPPAPEPEPTPTEAELHDIGALLVRYLREAPDEAKVREAASRAARIRREHLAAAENAEVTAARQVAEEIRRERAFLEDRARGGTMSLLRNLDTHLPELVGDERRFVALFERRTSGPVVNATPGPYDALLDGTTFSFPPGVHKLELPRTERFPRDILVQGSGMDATLVQFAELSSRDEVHSLTFRDLTIDCQDNYLTDLRSAPASIRLERCRVVRFDMGAGGSVMLSVPQVAFYATDCRFEAGFGRSPGSGNLFRFEAGLARLDRCVIQGPFLSIYYASGKATFHFSRCEILDTVPQDDRRYSAPPQGVRFVDCTVTSLPRDPETRRDPRPLSHLNHAWPSR